MLKKSLIGFTTALWLISCGSPQTAPNALQPTSSASKVLPAERWLTAQKGRISTYPPLARLAGISGDVVMRLNINEQGKVTGTKLLSGPPQLASTVDAFARSIQFSPLPADIPGPWQFSLTARFDLAGLVGVAPSGQPITLEVVSTSTPSVPRGLR